VVESRKKLFDLRDETKEHISTIYTELKEVNQEIAEIKRNIKWVKNS